MRLLATLDVRGERVRLDDGGWIPVEDLEARLRAQGYRAWKARELAEGAARELRRARAAAEGTARVEGRRRHGW